ncbi:hypothetical protein [Aureitalea marina]|uniref:Uncharacterized protein n=1 Tax=Aureitalea marina TaxID=930804 RepID=A0A2S7KPR2_9FLAO|nr:hypothetical protein [Aureitalea marina]PQB04612.1 hypothetical protein BST85_06665 [Aureitalea marina]
MNSTIRTYNLYLHFWLLLAVALFSGTFELIGQQQDTLETKRYSESDRRWLLDLPLWIPGLRGKLAYGELEFSSGGGDSEREFDRLNGDTGLEFYFSARFQLDLGKFQIYADGFTGRIGTSFQFQRPDGSATELVYYRVNGSIVRLMGGYALLDSGPEPKLPWKLYGYLGVRYINMSLFSQLPGGSDLVNVEPSFFEPMLGAVIALDPGRFRIEAHLDASTWDNNFTWALSNSVRYRISPLIDVHLGTAWYNIDYRKELGGQTFDMDISLFGPTAGVGFWIK